MKKALVVVVVVICGLLVWFGCQKNKPADQMETPAVTEQAKDEAPVPAEQPAAAPAEQPAAAPAEGTNTGSGN